MAVEVNFGTIKPAVKKEVIRYAPLGCQIFDLCRLANNFSFYR